MLKNNNYSSKSYTFNTKNVQILIQIYCFEFLNIYKFIHDKKLWFEERKVRRTKNAETGE
jgi:hypothetical protein